jgi:rhodanese-related sulfurtransferase
LTTFHNYYTKQKKSGKNVLWNKYILEFSMTKKIKKTKQKSNKFNTWLILGGIVIISLAVLFGTQLGNTDVAVLPLEVNVSQAYEMRESGAFVLDVREPDEWETVHIPGATLIPLGELENRLTELPENRDILVVCRSGNRSAAARDVLLNAGFENVTSMAGGMNDWVNQSFETETGP